MQIIQIDSNNFSSLEGFYSEIENYLALGECPWGRNLDSLDEITRCRFNYTSNPEIDVNKIIWLNSNKAKKDLIEKRGNKPVYQIIREIFLSVPEIIFEEK